jgi:hypothetical protein
LATDFCFQLFKNTPIYFPPQMLASMVVPTVLRTAVRPPAKLSTPATFSAIHGRNYGVKSNHTNPLFYGK